MKDQHKKIKGYRDLSQNEIDLMNRVKSHAELTKQLLNDVAMLRLQDKEFNTLTREQLVESPRCLEKAQSHLQEGFMWFVRAIALPDSF